MIRFENENEVPVLILFFNRLGGMENTFNILREIKAKYIYLASDGARSESESFGVDLIRNKVESFIDWPCEIKTLYRKDNLGCKLAVSTAIQWFFSEVDAGIVLEDDCTPNLTFFKFCKNMLNAYRGDKSVATISGRKHFDIDMNQDYSFCNRFFCWGWASWSDRITGLDVDEPYSATYELHSRPECTIENMYVNGVIGLLKSKQVNSWAYSYEMLFREKHQYCIVPNANMIRNVGFGDGGTHSKSWLEDPRPFEELANCEFRNDYLITPKTEYLRKGLLQEYKGFFWLFIFSRSKYLKLIRLCYRWLRKRF